MFLLLTKAYKSLQILTNLFLIDEQTSLSKNGLRAQAVYDLAEIIIQILTNAYNFLQIHTNPYLCLLMFTNAYKSLQILTNP